MNFSRMIFFSKLILIRGFGSIIYSFVAAACIPAKNFSEVVFILPLLEFFAGMLFPVLRTAIIANRISSGVAFALSAIVGLSLLFGLTFYLQADLKNIIYSLFLFCFVPFALCASAELERRDISYSLKVEAKSATLSVLTASILIYLGSKFNSIDFFSSPLLRGVLFPLIFLLVVDTSMLRNSINFRTKKNINFKMFFALRGVDYLFLLSLVKINLLASLRVLPLGSELVKFLILSYDLLSAFVAYFLRARYADVKFKSKDYVEKNKLIFFGLILISILLCSFGVLLISSYLSTYFFAASAVFLLLAMSGMTTAIIVGYGFDYILTLILLIIGLIFLKGEFPYWVNIAYYNFTIIICLVQFASIIKIKIGVLFR